MKYIRSVLLVIVLSLFITLNSCEKENDFVQEPNFKTSSAFNSDLMTSSFDVKSFNNISNEGELQTLTDTTYLAFNGSTFFMEKLSRTNLNFQFENRFEQEFKINIEFLNDLDDLKFTLTIPVSSGAKNKPATVETNVVIETSELETFKEATKMVYNITLIPDTTSVSLKSDGFLELKSSAKYILGY